MSTQQKGLQERTTEQEKSSKLTKSWAVLKCRFLFSKLLCRMTYITSACVPFWANPNGQSWVLLRSHLPYFVKGQVWWSSWRNLRLYSTPIRAQTITGRVKAVKPCSFNQVVKLAEEDMMNEVSLKWKRKNSGACWLHTNTRPPFIFFIAKM